MSIINFFIDDDIIISINNRFRYARQPRTILEKIPFKEIIYYLNDKTGKKFRYTNPKSKEKITSRWNEGYRLDDFKKVIDVKVAEWTGTNYAMYIRPETLFGSKFEGYVNQEREGTNICPNPECQYLLNGTEINCPKCHWRIR